MLNVSGRVTGDDAQPRLELVVNESFLMKDWNPIETLQRFMTFHPEVNVTNFDTETETLHVDGGTVDPSGFCPNDYEE
jgi:hypothetical protein